MKKKIAMKAMVVAGVMALAGWVMSGSAWAGISGSAHDFSGDSWSGGRICVVCHTPHNAKTGNDNLVPLWNHAVTSTTFDLYGSSTLNAGTGGVLTDQPEGVSKACLSCHDGTVAIDSFGGTSGSTTLPTNDDHNLGTDLSNDHPISFTYDTTLASNDGGLNDPAATPAVAALLVAGKVECSSCHDVHDAAGNDDLLVIANTGSALCLTCHDK